MKLSDIKLAGYYLLSCSMVQELFKNRSPDPLPNAVEIITFDSVKINVDRSDVFWERYIYRGPDFNDTHFPRAIYQTVPGTNAFLRIIHSGGKEHMMWSLDKESGQSCAIFVNKSDSACEKKGFFYLLSQDDYVYIPEDLEGTLYSKRFGKTDMKLVNMFHPTKIYRMDDITAGVDVQGRRIIFTRDALTESDGTAQHTCKQTPLVDVSKSSYCQKPQPLNWHTNRSEIMSFAYLHGLQKLASSSDSKCQLKFIQTDIMNTYVRFLYEDRKDMGKKDDADEHDDSTLTYILGGCAGVIFIILVIIGIILGCMYCKKKPPQSDKQEEPKASPSPEPPKPDETKPEPTKNKKTEKSDKRKSKKNKKSERKKKKQTEKNESVVSQSMKEESPELTSVSARDEESEKKPSKREHKKSKKKESKRKSTKKSVKKSVKKQKKESKRHEKKEEKQKKKETPPGGGDYIVPQDLNELSLKSDKSGQENKTVLTIGGGPETSRLIPDQLAKLPNKNKKPSAKKGKDASKNVKVETEHDDEDGQSHQGNESHGSMIFH